MRKKPYEGRHPECVDCAFFKPSGPSVQCLGCGAGEFFEEAINDAMTADEEEMRRVFKQMDRDYE